MQWIIENLLVLLLGRGIIAMHLFGRLSDAQAILDSTGGTRVSQNKAGVT